MVAVTNYHICGSLKQQRLILTQFRRPEAWNQHYWAKIKAGRATLPPEGLGENLLFLNSSGFWWQPESFDGFQDHTTPGPGFVVPLPLLFFPVLSNFPLPPSYKDAYDWIWGLPNNSGKFPNLKILNLITPAIWCNIHKFQKLGHGYLGGELLSVYHSTPVKQVKCKDYYFSFIDEGILA